VRRSLIIEAGEGTLPEGGDGDGEDLLRRAVVDGQASRAAADVDGLTGAETFWYVLMNFAFGAGYSAKVIAAKAISELPQFTQARQAAGIW
jgi:hypothetical protein